MSRSVQIRQAIKRKRKKKKEEKTRTNLEKQKEDISSGCVENRQSAQLKKNIREYRIQRIDYSRFEAACFLQIFHPTSHLFP